MVENEIKPGLTERALSTRRAIVMGIGGGGDIIQAIPIAHYLKLVGVETVYMGGVSCQWWTLEGEWRAEGWGEAILGPTIYDVRELSHATHWSPGVVEVGPTSDFHEHIPAEAILADHLPGDGTFVAGLRDGVAGLRDNLRQVIDEKEIDLFVGVDIGSDSFHNGQEIQPAYTSLVDFMSLSAMIQLELPTIYGVSGFGCDGEMQLEELQSRVATVMAHGGYLGALGLSQRDVASMMSACEICPDPIEHLAPRAARGEFGWRRLEVGSPWGTPARVTPLASVMLFFDPRTLVQHVAKGVLELRDTHSLEEAEHIYRTTLGQIPETRLKHLISYVRE